MLTSLASRRCLGAAAAACKSSMAHDVIPFGLAGVRRSLRGGPLAFKESDRQESPSEAKQLQSDLAQAPRMEDMPARLARDALDLNPVELLTSPSFR